MASVIMVTGPGGVIVGTGGMALSGSSLLQPIDQALDISAIDQMDVEVGVTLLTGSTVQVNLDLLTSSQKDSDDASWLVMSPGLIGGVTAPGYWRQSYPSGLLRFLRWKITVTTGTLNTAAFWIAGMGRTTSRS